MDDQKTGVQALGELVQQDEALAQKLRDAVLAKDFAEVIRLAAEHGITITEADFPPVNDEIAEGEIDEAELANIAGGDIVDTSMDVWVYCGLNATVQCGAFVGIALWNPCGAARD